MYKEINEKESMEINGGSNPFYELGYKIGRKVRKWFKIM